MLHPVQAGDGGAPGGGDFVDLGLGVLSSRAQRGDLVGMPPPLIIAIHPLAHRQIRPLTAWRTGDETAIIAPLNPKQLGRHAPPQAAIADGHLIQAQQLQRRH